MASSKASSGKSKRTVTVHKPKLHSGQLAILFNPSRFKVAACGRRFGKSMLACYWLVMQEGSAMSGKPVAYFAPTYKLLLDAWSGIKRAISPIISRSNRTDMRIELVTGGSIDFWTLQDLDAGRSRKYARVVIDEAAHAPHLKDIWEKAIGPTLSDVRGDAWFISTPRGINFFHELFQRPGKENYPDWASFQLPTTTNPTISPDEIEGWRRELPELVFRQEYLGQFVDFGAGVLKPECIETGIAPPRLQTVLGVDLAISQKDSADWTVIVAMTRDPVTGVIYILEVERYRCGFNDILTHIKAAAARHNPVMIAIEQTQYQAAIVQELARTTKLPVRGVHPDKDKYTRFTPLLTRYEQHMVRHDPARVPIWFRDELLAFPQGEYDDGVDAAAYAYMALPVTIPGTLQVVKSERSGW